MKRKPRPMWLDQGHILQSFIDNEIAVKIENEKPDVWIPLFNFFFPSSLWLVLRSAAFLLSCQLDVIGIHHNFLWDFKSTELSAWAVSLVPSGFRISWNRKKSWQKDPACTSGQNIHLQTLVSLHPTEKILSKLGGFIPKTPESFHCL